MRTCQSGQLSRLWLFSFGHHWPNSETGSETVLWALTIDSVEWRGRKTRGYISPLARAVRSSAINLVIRAVGTAIEDRCFVGRIESARGSAYLRQNGLSYLGDRPVGTSIFPDGFGGSTWRTTSSRCGFTPPWIYESDFHNAVAELANDSASNGNRDQSYL